jgi:hypothetical protein
MIHIAQVREELAKHQPVSLQFIKKNGDLIQADNVVCTSSYFENDTVNLKFLDSEEFRKIHVCQIIELNGEEVCL